MLDTTPSHQAQRWLDQFGQSLAGDKPDAVVALFTTDCYWRDLVSFTWNICTQDGHKAVRDMLTARQAETQASNFQLEGVATAADGVTDAWFIFDTHVSRGRGHLRLKDGQAWTLLTTMVELKGFEEKKAHRASWALSTAPNKDARAGWSDAMKKSLAWVTTNNPMW